MGITRRAFKGAAVLGAGQAVGQICGLARNVIVARILSPDDFGVAATFVILVSFLDVLSNMSPDALLVQAADGDDPRLQSTSQMIQALRGLGMAVLLFALARPFAALFKVEQATWAFRWLAFAPLLRNLMHLDQRRVQRDLRFAPSIWVELIPQLVALALAWPLAIWLKNYGALLWLLIIQVAVGALVSHLLATRPYRWGYDREFARRIMSFGWPLLVNGILLFAMMQGDRVVIGTLRSTTDLGMYSAAFLLTNAAAMFLNKLASALMFPLLAQVQHDPAAFLRRYRMLIATWCIIGGCFGILFTVAGGLLITAVYGAQYQRATSIVGWLGVMQAFRLIRSAPTTASFAKGDSKNTLVANSARIVITPVLFMAASLGGDLKMIAAIGAGAEMIALMISACRLTVKDGVPLVTTLGPVTLATALVGGSMALHVTGIAVNWWSTCIAVTGLCAAQCVTGLLGSMELRRLLTKQLCRWTKAGVPRVDPSVGVIGGA